MIIDCNAHITETGTWFDTNIPCDVKTLLLQMDAAGVDKAVLTPFHGIISNQFVLETAKRYPGRLMAACSVNPIVQKKDDIKNELEKLYGEGVKICKLHNRLHRYDPSDEAVYHFLELNEHLKNPMVIYMCGQLYNKYVQPSAPPPVFFHHISRSFPNTVFVIMHAATVYALQVAEAIKDNPNVYLDLSFVIPKYKGSSIDLDLKYLIANFDRRLLWGSDFPEYSLMGALEDFNQLSIGMAPEKIENILYRNFLSIV